VFKITLNKICTKNTESVQCYL